MVWLLDFHNDKETKPTHEFSAPDPHDLIPLRKLTAMLCYTQHNILCMTHQFVFHTTSRFYRGRWHKELDWNSKVMNFLFCYFFGLFVVSDAVLFFVVVIIVRLTVWTWVWLQPWPNSNDLPSQSHKNNKYNNDNSNNNNNSDNNNNHHHHIMIMIIIYYKAQIT